MVGRGATGEYHPSIAPALVNALFFSLRDTLEYRGKRFPLRLCPLESPSPLDTQLYMSVELFVLEAPHFSRKGPRL